MLGFDYVTWKSLLVSSSNLEFFYVGIEILKNHLIEGVFPDSYDLKK